MDVSDNDMALAAAGGDATAFSTLLSRHYDRIFGFCFKLTGRRADAEDLTQDICATLPAKIRHFEGRAQFTTWLYRVIVNAAHDQRRKRATYSRVTENWGSWELGRQAEMTETASQIDWLNEAMSQLPNDLRDTLALVLDDVSHKAAGEVLGVSEGTISWRMSQVKQHLKSIKEQEDEA